MKFITSGLTAQQQRKDLQRTKAQLNLYVGALTKHNERLKLLKDTFKRDMETTYSTIPCKLIIKALDKAKKDSKISEDLGMQRHAMLTLLTSIPTFENTRNELAKQRNFTPVDTDTEIVNLLNDTMQTARQNIEVAEHSTYISNVLNTHDMNGAKSAAHYDAMDIIEEVKHNKDAIIAENTAILNEQLVQPSADVYVDYDLDVDLVNRFIDTYIEYKNEIAIENYQYSQFVKRTFTPQFVRIAKQSIAEYKRLSKLNVKDRRTTMSVQRVIYQSNAFMDYVEAKIEDLVAESDIVDYTITDDTVQVSTTSLKDITNGNQVIEALNDRVQIVNCEDHGLEDTAENKQLIMDYRTAANTIPTDISGVDAEPATMDDFYNIKRNEQNELNNSGRFYNGDEYLPADVAPNFDEAQKLRERYNLENAFDISRALNDVNKMMKELEIGHGGKFIDYLAEDYEHDDYAKLDERFNFMKYVTKFEAFEPLKLSVLANLELRMLQVKLDAGYDNEYVDKIANEKLNAAKALATYKQKRSNLLIRRIDLDDKITQLEFDAAQAANDKDAEVHAELEQARKTSKTYAEALDKLNGAVEQLEYKILGYNETIERYNETHATDIEREQLQERFDAIRDILDRHAERVSSYKDTLNKNDSVELAEDDYSELDEFCSTLP